MWPQPPFLQQEVETTVCVNFLVFKCWLKVVDQRFAVSESQPGLLVSQLEDGGPSRAETQQVAQDLPCAP